MPSIGLLKRKKWPLWMLESANAISVTCYYNELTHLNTLCVNTRVHFHEYGSIVLCCGNESETVSALK